MESELTAWLEGLIQINNPKSNYQQSVCMCKYLCQSMHMNVYVRVRVCVHARACVCACACACAVKPVYNGHHYPHIDWVKFAIPSMWYRLYEMLMLRTCDLLLTASLPEAQDRR